MVKKKARDLRIKLLMELVIGLAIIITVNQISVNRFIRIDLTKEQRYTLSEASRNMAQRLDDIMFVKVYLEGDFPADFNRLRNATREMLDEFRVYAGDNIEYEFIDPFADATKQQAQDILEQLSGKGLQPTNVQQNAQDELSQKLIVPGALVYYKGNEYPINLLRGQFGAAPEVVINRSIELLEYEIANAIRKCIGGKKKQIGFLEGHGELDKYQVADITRELSDFYQVDRVDLTLQVPEKLNNYDGLIIAKPVEKFTDFDKFKLDQYVMSGGKLLWLVETQLAEMDSLRNKERMFMTASYDLNLDDLLFRYGVRINYNLIQDLQCNKVPVVTNVLGGGVRKIDRPWVFYPLLGAGNESHPIARNIDLVWSQFANSIDTIKSEKIKKTILLRSSEISRVSNAPARVDIKMTALQPDRSVFNKPYQPVAVLLEGSFESIFRYRNQPKSSAESLPFKASIDSNKMIVISDGDIIRNDIRKETGEIYPLGFDRKSGQTFGNLKFILNCVDYLCDDSGIISVRGKQVQLRLLNKERIKSERVKWQLINMAIPTLLVIIFAVVNAFIRRRRFA